MTTQTRNLIAVSAVIFITLLIIFGSSLFTHAEAGIKTARKHILDKQSDEMIIEGVKAELRKSKEQLAINHAEVMRFKRDVQREEDIINNLQETIFSHQTALQESDILLSSDERYFPIDGGKVSRPELETDVFQRIKVLEELRSDYEFRSEGYREMQEAYNNVNQQLNIAEQNFKPKEQQLHKLEMDLKANRIKKNFEDNIASMMSGLENSSLNEAFCRLEDRVLVLKSQAEPSTSSSHLLNFSNPINTPDAREAIRRALTPEISEPGDPRSMNSNMPTSITTN